MSALRILTLAAIALTLDPQMYAKTKDRDWQTGAVLDPLHSPYFTASTNDAPYGGNVDVPLMKVYDSYLFEGAGSAYFVREGRRWERTKPANLKPGDSVKFAVDGQRIYVLDPNGKEHRMELVKQVPRAKP